MRSARAAIVPTSAASSAEISAARMPATKWSESSARHCASQVAANSQNSQWAQRIGTVSARDVGGDQPPQLLAETPPVRLHVDEADRLRPTRSEVEVQASRRCTLDGGQGVGVEAQLQHVAGLGLGSRQLGVDRLVAERTEA